MMTLTNTHLVRLMRVQICRAVKSKIWRMLFINYLPTA